MVQLDAGIIGPDGLGGAYKNTASVLESLSWFALAGRQGVLKGMTLAGVAGSMAVDVAAGACLVSRRDGANNAQDMGYHVPVPATTRVTFGAASVAARNDALVCAVVDTTDGAVGTGALAVGGHLVVVPGVSGTVTPRTDAQIAAYLGRGGFVRLADVPIASTDTQITMANVVYSADSVPIQDSGTISDGVFTQSTGWSLTAQTLRKKGNLTSFYIAFTRTGAAIAVSTFTGDIVNSAVVTWDATKWPISIRAAATSGGSGRSLVADVNWSGSVGTISIASAGGSSDIATSEVFSLAGTWLS